MIKYLIEDLKLALNENIYTHEINKNKNEEIKEGNEEDDKAKNIEPDSMKNLGSDSINNEPDNNEQK